ncbi:unnamed protein product [Calypogeia fissa]
MDVGDTQLIDDSPPRSSSGESTGYDCPMHEPTQLLYTQLFDQYEVPMNNAHKRQHIDLDLETQLIDDHNFDDFRKNGGLIMPSEDEASKETQLIHGDEVHSGSSSGKDGEVDSALSPLSSAFSQKPSHWLTEFTQRDRIIEGVSGRASQMNFPFRDRYLGETQILSGETQILSDEETVGPHDHSAKDQRNFVSNRAGGASNYPDLQNRDGDVPHFLRDFDPNKQDYAGQQGPVGSWQEVTGQSEDRGWETAVRNLQLVDSDASTEDGTENHNNSVFNTDLSYPGQTKLSQNANPRSPTRSSNLFCKQDLNKLPEPEFMMDGWEEENGADLGIGKIDEGVSNVELLNGVEKVALACPPQSTPMETGINEVLNERILRAPQVMLRTAGSIRVASLRASSLQAFSRSSSGRHLHSIPQGSEIEEVQNSKRDATNIEMPRDVSQKVVGSSSDTTAVSGPTMERGHSAATLPSVLSNSIGDANPPRTDQDRDAVKATDHGDAEVTDLSKVGASMQGAVSSVLGTEVSKPAEKSPRSVREPFLEEGDELERRVLASDDDGEAKSQSSLERVDPGKESETEPSRPGETHSSPAGKSLERRSSFGSGLFSGGSDMSYLSTQSPGEESQARALNMVDKLVWLNAIGLPQELQLEDEKSPPRAPSHAKSVLQSRIQVAEAKAGMDDPFGVFDWVDSQNDDAGAFFGGGTARASASKGASKASIDVAQLKQSGIGSKKGGVVDALGSRNKKAEKLPEKAKFVKPTPNTDKHKGLTSKNIPGGTENRKEQHQGGRSGNGSGAMEIRQERGYTEASAGDCTDSHLGRLGSATDRPSGLPDKCFNKFGAMDICSTAEKIRLVSTLKVPQHQQRSKLLADQARPEKFSNDTRFEHRKESPNASKDTSKALDLQNETGEREADKQVGDPENLRKEHVPTSAQSRSILGPKGFHDGQTAVVAEASVGNVHCVLQETKAPDEMEQGGSLMQQAIGDAGLSHQVVGNNIVRTIESGSETVPRMSDKAGCSPQFQKDDNGELLQTVGGHVEKLSAVSPQNSPQNGQAFDNVNDFVNLHQVSDLTTEDDVDKGSLFERVENHHASSKPTLDGTKVQSITDGNHSRSNGHLEGSFPASGNLRTTDQPEGQHSPAKLSIPDADTGPGTDDVVIEMTVKSSKSNSTSGNCKVSPKDEGNENTDITSDLVSLRNDIKDEREPKVENEIQSAPPKATRRGRSQTRYSSKPLENSNPSSGRNSFMNREKGRGRRVTWAGPLVEDMRRHSVGVRSPRSSRQQPEVRGEDVVDSAADSSAEGEEEEPEHLKEEPKAVNVSRKRNLETLETGARYSDLDKIKRRFNMSDAAVARLLGTDEEEDPDLINETTGVKVRSLSHIQPEADGNGDEITVPNFRRVSKGLRSVRGRSEEGVRRPWPFTSSDQGKSNGEEVLYPPDQSAVPAGGMNGISGDCHPSDNEFMTGRRRMRSIADVSFSNLPHTTPGRPPLARGLRRKRARHVFISPPEAITDPSDDDLPPTTASISPLIGKFRGKGGPRSARKRKEAEPDLMPSTSEVSMSPNSSKETSPTSFKRRKRTGTISVLLSHGLNEDTIKQQKKIVAKLGGRVATSASECSHFVADKFVRTGNMLEAMASGKPVVNIGWLDTCSEAYRFVEEDDFILQDAKKEEEMGFSMIRTLAAARQRPLLQGIRVYITPGTSPGPDSLARIVKSAGGQVVDQYCGPAPDGEQESNFCVVISSEEEFEDCIPLLEQGAKVYTPELILSGVTSYHLDFANDQLFRNFAIRRRRGSSSRRPV